MKIEKHKHLLVELHETYKSKNQLYGDAFGETIQKYGLISALTRMHDKFSRIETMILGELEDEESLRDSLMDLANYCLMTVLESEISSKVELNSKIDN